MEKRVSIKKLSLAGMLTGMAIIGSFISFPVAGSKCAPVQHMVNVFAAIMLGPFYGVVMAFCSSLIRNLWGIGSPMAFPGSMVGALISGILYHILKKEEFACIGEVLGTGIFGGLLAYPVAKSFMGLNPSGFTIYIIPFLISTVAGSVLAYIIAKILGKGIIKRFE